MLTSVFIIVISAVLFAYWLRYSCVLLLRSAEERSQSNGGPDERFSLAAVLQRLGTDPDLADLERSLDRDYKVVTYIIGHTTDLELASMENKLLVLDYKMMRAWSRLTRTLAPGQSREALREMASVLQVLAAQLGEQHTLRGEA